MHVTSVINLKGGVGKTVSAINMAHILAHQHAKRVLLIDNDKQGNTSRFFGLYDEEKPGMFEILTEKDYPISRAVKRSGYIGLDILPANISQLMANKLILEDKSRPQQTRLRDALEEHTRNFSAFQYDFVIIDNPPDLDMCVINALTASDDVLIPVKTDRFAFEGLQHITEQIESIKPLNPKIKILGCFITMYQSTLVNVQGAEHLKESGLPIFETMIRKTVKVDETTYAGEPLLKYSRSSTATFDYISLVNEYLEKTKKVLGTSTNYNNSKLYSNRSQLA